MKLLKSVCKRLNGEPVPRRTNGRSLLVSVVAGATVLSAVVASADTPSYDLSKSRAVAIKALDIVKMHSDSVLTPDLNAVIEARLAHPSDRARSSYVSPTGLALPQIDQDLSGPGSSGDRVASKKVASPAMPSAPPAPVDVPDCTLDLSAQLQASGEAMEAFVTASEKKDTQAVQVLGPRIDAILDQMPVKELGPEFCRTHIIAFTNYQFFTLQVLKANKIDVGQMDKPIAKFPDLVFEVLPIVDAGIKVEQSDYDGAQRALAKGLVMYPHSSGLALQYASLMVGTKRYTEAIGFIDSFSSQTFDIIDANRAQLLMIRGISLMALGYVNDAETMLQVALIYDPGNEDIQGLLKVIEDAKAKASKS